MSVGINITWRPHFAHFAHSLRHLMSAEEINYSLRINIWDKDIHTNWRGEIVDGRCSQIRELVICMGNHASRVRKKFR